MPFSVGGSTIFEKIFISEPSLNLVARIFGVSAGFHIAHRLPTVGRTLFFLFYGHIILAGV